MKKSIYFGMAFSALLFASCEKDQISSDNFSGTELSDQISTDYLTSDQNILEALQIKEPDTKRSYVDKNQSSLYTISNEVAGNRILVFNRASDGTLSEAGSYETGGTGTGEGLGNQGALALSENKIFLFAVSPGSDEISFSYIRGDGSLLLLDKITDG